MADGEPTPPDTAPDHDLPPIGPGTASGRPHGRGQGGSFSPVFGRHTLKSGPTKADPQTPGAGLAARRPGLKPRARLPLPGPPAAQRAPKLVDLRPEPSWPAGLLVEKQGRFASRTSAPAFTTHVEIDPVFPGKVGANITNHTLELS